MPRSMSTNTSTHLAEGRLIGDRYLIGRVIGEGGMGVVYSARHVGLDVPVAFKVIRPDLKNDPEFVQRFLHEARAAASLKGEHIAHVHDVGQLESGEPYLVMEHLEGMGLESFVRERGLLPESEAVKLVREACAGLGEAHAMMLVHRDIKLANLFLVRRTDGSSLLKVLDFGISKHFSSSARGLTNPERSLGSPWYMSPEQMMNASEVDQRTDVWSLGVVLFELLTGEHPFDGDTVPEVCGKVLTAPAPPLRKWKADADAKLEAVVSWCLEKDPENRCPNVTVLSAALQPFAGSSADHGLSMPHAGATNCGSLAFDRTMPDAKIHSGRREERITLGSLAPVADHLGLGPRRRWRTMTAVVGLTAGVSFAAFAWSHPATSHQVLRSMGDSRLELPWDPRLGEGPFHETFTKDYDLPPWMFRAISPNASTSSVVMATEVEPTEKHWGATLTPEEIQRRTENYGNWLRRQGFQRIEDVAAVEDRTPASAATVQDEDGLDRTGAASQ